MGYERYKRRIQIDKHSKWRWTSHTCDNITRTVVTMTTRQHISTLNKKIIIDRYRYMQHTMNGWLIYRANWSSDKYIYTKWECRITAEVSSCTQWLYRSQNIQQSRHNNKTTTNYMYMYTRFYLQVLFTVNLQCISACRWLVVCDSWKMYWSFIDCQVIVRWLSCDCHVIVVWLSGYKTNVMIKVSGIESD